MPRTLSMDVIKVAQENDIHLLCLPSHTTHLLQLCIQAI